MDVECWVLKKLNRPIFIPFLHFSTKATLFVGLLFAKMVNKDEYI